jgi:mannose-6-phosphate isomerase-like protein (cupin superfamily)
MKPKMTPKFKLSSTFVHLSDGGDAERVELTPAFWRESSGGKKKHDRLLGVFEFRSAADLHSSMEEMHPEADEVIYVVAGAIDLILDESDGKRIVTIEAGEASIVPRGVWHRLVMRKPGKLLFINSRTGMQGRRHRPTNRSKTTGPRRPAF